MDSDEKADRTDQDPEEGKIVEEAFLVLAGMIFPIESLVFSIGRNLDNDLVLNDPTVSRFHAEIRYVDSQFLLVDLNSSSGTYLNNQRITVSQLFAGDIVQISHTPILFMFKGASIVDGAGKHTGKLEDLDKLDLDE